MTTCQGTADTILDGTNEWQELYRSHNFKALSQLYTTDCRVFPSGSSISNGRVACAKVWEDMYHKGVERVTKHNEEHVTAGGPMAADRSRYISYDKAGKEVDRGKYVAVWKNVDGKLLIHYEIFNSDNPDVKDSKAEVVLASDKWEHYFRTQNFVALSRLYSEDCKVFPPGMAVAIGRDACKNAWQGLASMGVSRIDIDNVETLDMGDTLAADRSTYVMYNMAGKKIDHGKYVVLWKRVQGKWYLHYDIFNSDVMNY